jgi:hypothetical protein
LHVTFIEELMAHTIGPTPHAQYGMAPSGLDHDEGKPGVSGNLLIGLNFI